MPPTDHKNSLRVRPTTHCTRQRPFRNDPSYIGLTDDENTTPPPRKALDAARRLRTSANTNARSPRTVRSTASARIPPVPRTTSSLPSKLPRTSSLPYNSNTISTAARDSAVWFKSPSTLITPPVTPIRPLEIRKSSKKSTPRLDKPLPSRPAITMGSDPSPSKDGHSLIDASERQLDISQFPALPATPSVVATGSQLSIAGRGADAGKGTPSSNGSRIPRATFWASSPSSLTPSRVQYVARPANSPGRPYTPPPASYSTVRPARGSIVSRTSLVSTPRPQFASHVPVSSLTSARLVDIAKPDDHPQSVESPSVDVEAGVGGEMETPRSAAPAPTIPTRAEQCELERGRRGFFQGSKSKEKRSKSKSRAVIEKMSGLVHRKRGPAISAPVKGSFRHNELPADPRVFSNHYGDDSSTTMPPLSGNRQILSDRLPPPPPIPASQPPLSHPRRTATSMDLTSDEDLDLDDDEKVGEIGADLVLAANHLKSLADRTNTAQTKASFLILAKTFSDAKILVNETSVAVLMAKRSTQRAMWYFREAKGKALELERIARQTLPNGRSSRSRE